MQIWIARDHSYGKELSENIRLFRQPPEYHPVFGWLAQTEISVVEKTGFVLFPDSFPEIKNGECYQAEITLGEKV